MKFVVLAVLTSCLLAACATDPTGQLGSDEPSDYVVTADDGKADGVLPTFDPNDVVGDDVFLADGQLDTAAVQAFLEHSPYGNRSWLADYTTSEGTTAAEAIVAAADDQGVSPMMLLVRMQVEASIVSKSTRPSSYRIDHALGCGCPDGSGCSSSYTGFTRQLACGATVLRKWYDASVDGTGEWRKGVSRRTLDPRTVRPANHATASLYAYTPWVLVGRGGNWLVWNVSRKYVRHAKEQGLLQ